MRWEKKGLLYCADGFSPWAVSHATMPLPYFPSPDRLRLYVSFCTADTVSRVSFIEVSSADPTQLLYVHKTPVLDIGEEGAFDDNGVLPLSLVDLGDRLWMYYVGFQLGVKTPYTLFSGLAESTDGGLNFTRLSRTPVLDRSDKEMFVRTAPSVLKEEGGWKMWYIGGNEWTVKNGKKLPIYTLHYVESADGINWPREGRSVLEFASDDEHGFGRPWVWKEGNGYKMFYSIRSFSKGYRMGYAESNDGINWDRKDDEMNLPVSTEGWDSEMVCFGAPIILQNQMWLFYNGNNFGRSGVGLAEAI